jgi:signal transduction histidine kinase
MGTSDQKPDTSANRSIESLVQECDDLRAQLAEAQQHNRDKTDFIVNMGHDIRTPLHGILGMTNLVLESSLTDEQRSYLEMVSSSAERLSDVVAQSLVFTRIEAGSLTLKDETVALAETLDYELYVLRLTAQKKNLTLTFTVSREIPRQVNTDIARLLQVIGHLVNNAIKFTTKGSIEVLVRVVTRQADGALVLKCTVTDTGIGIAPEKLAGIRDKFHHNHTSFARKYWGGGIGLTVAARIVQLAGGEIDVESTDGLGATFWFTWPCRSAVPETINHQPPPDDEVESA